MERKPFFGDNCKPVLLASIMAICATLYFKIVVVLALSEAVQICIIFIALCLVIGLYVLTDCGV